MRINREKVFGPIARVFRVRYYDDALAVVNETKFDLIAGICTQSLKEVSDFKCKAEAGMVMVDLPTARDELSRPIRRPQEVKPQGAWAGTQRRQVPEHGQDRQHCTLSARQCCACEIAGYTLPYDFPPKGLPDRPEHGPMMCRRDPFEGMQRVGNKQRVGKLAMRRWGEDRGMSHAIAVCHGAFGRAALYQLDKTIITHAHREGHLVFHVDGAPAWVEVVGQRHMVLPGKGVAVSPWEPHSFHVHEGGTQICLVLYIKPMWFLENSSSAEFALKFGQCGLPVSADIRDAVHRLTALILDNEDQARFNDALFGLTRECFDMSWIGASLARRASACRRFSDFRVRRALRLFQESFAQDIEMESLARKVGLSRPHFFKLFKQYMGVTPNVYMNTLRSEHALDDLLRTPKTVTDIAFDLGFSSQASFTRFFSSNVGIAPSEYRRVAHVTN